MVRNILLLKFSYFDVSKPAGYKSQLIFVVELAII